MLGIVLFIVGLGLSYFAGVGLSECFNGGDGIDLFVSAGCASFGFLFIYGGIKLIFFVI